MIRSYLNKRRRFLAAPKKRGFAHGFVEQLEDRSLLTATMVGQTTLTSPVEISTIYNSNSYIPVQAVPHGTGSYSFAQWGFLEFGPSSNVFNGVSPASDINSLSIQLYNSGTSGNYSPHAGSFSIYVIPNDTVSGLGPNVGGPGDMRFKSTTAGDFGDNNTNFGADSLGTTGGNRTALGITGNAADWLVGTWDITSSLQGGYSTFTASSTGGSTSSGTGTSGSAANMGSLARASIADDLTHHTPLRFAIVANDAGMAADWEGNYNGSVAPKILMDYTVAPTVQETFNLDSSQFTVDKAAGVVHVQIDRTSTGDLSDTATVHYSIADGTGRVFSTTAPYSAAPAINGVDYNSTGLSGTASFAAFSSTAFIDIPILDNSADYGDATFSVTISSPATGDGARVGVLGSGTKANVVITDSRTVDVSQNSSDNSTIEQSGPYATSYFPIENANAGTFASFGVLDYNTPGGGYEYSVPSTVGTINQIAISTVAGFPVQAWTHAGTLNVYLVDDASADIHSAGLTFNTSLDPVEGVGNQLGTKHLLGTMNYDPSQPIDVFSSYDLTSTDAATLNVLKNDLNSGTKFRIVVTPGDGVVAADFEGQYTFDFYEAPILSFNYTPASSLPAWLAPGSQATWDSGNQTLDVTGTATIIADPAGFGDFPAITANSAGDDLIVDPTNSDTLIHIASLALSGGATTTVDSVGVSRSHTNHLALVIGSSSVAGVLSSDSSSKLDLVDNDLIVHHGSYSAVQALAAAGRNVAPGGAADGPWDGNGLTSSAAATDFSNNGYELTALAVVRNGELPLGSFSDWHLGAHDEALASDDLIVKYTYTGDVTLSGAVDTDATVVLGALYDNGATSGHGWWEGDLNDDGLIDTNDDVVLSALYGNGLTNGPRL